MANCPLGLVDAAGLVGRRRRNCHRLKS
jgi:hypothetical protein